MQKYTDEELREIIAEEVIDVGDLCLFLELTVWDILEAFPEQMRNNAHKFTLPSSTDGILDDDDEDEEEEEDPEWEI